MLVHNLLGTFPGWKTQDGSPEESTRYYMTLSHNSLIEPGAVYDINLANGILRPGCLQISVDSHGGTATEGACVASLCWHFAAFVRRRFTMIHALWRFTRNSSKVFLSFSVQMFHFDYISLLANSKFCTWFWYTNSIKLHQHKKLLFPLHVCCVDSCWWAVALAGHWRPSQGLETCQGLLPLVDLKRTRDQFM